jgi:predicted SprT family Zn-dependent metalloprotease
LILETFDAETIDLIERYALILRLPTDRLHVTTERSTFERWLGRRAGSGIGGAYAFVARSGTHLVLINLARIDRSRAKSLEIVVAEELIHMRDRLDGDIRRHARHGYDRIAERVAALTGASLDEVRSSLLPRRSQPFRYLYACPGCGVAVRRRRRGTWSCGRCAARFDPRFVLQLVRDERSDG